MLKWQLIMEVVNPRELLKGHFLIKIGSVAAVLLAPRVRDLWWWWGRDCTDPPCFAEKLLQWPHCWLPQSPTSTAVILLLFLFKYLFFFFFFLNDKKMLCVLRQLSSSLLSEQAVLDRICLKSWKKGFELSLARFALNFKLLMACGGCVWTNPSVLSASAGLSSRLLLWQWHINHALFQIQLCQDWITKFKLLLFLSAVQQFAEPEPLQSLKD